MYWYIIPKEYRNTERKEQDSSRNWNCNIENLTILSFFSHIWITVIEMQIHGREEYPSSQILFSQTELVRRNDFVSSVSRSVFHEIEALSSERKNLPGIPRPSAPFVARPDTYAPLWNRPINLSEMENSFPLVEYVFCNGVFGYEYLLRGRGITVPSCYAFIHGFLTANGS